MARKKIEITPALREQLLQYQINEITEYHIYSRLARTLELDSQNREILESIARDEYRHYEFWKGHTGEEVRPSRIRILFYYWISRILGLTFGIKLMEQGEDRAKTNYGEVARVIPYAKRIAADEEKHERNLLNLLEEERLKYAGSVVLGLNDALVELTGALAGLTFALQDSRLIALAGLITGISASFSMAASEYLSTRSEEDDAKHALTSSLYTGTAYILTVAILILPYLLLENPYISLGFTLLAALAVIFVFNFYISVAKELPFRKRFGEMAFLSMGVALLSFFIGYGVRVILGVEV